jgi:hypothetical protein
MSNRALVYRPSDLFLSTDPHASDRSGPDKRAAGLRSRAKRFRLALSVSRSPFLPRLVTVRSRAGGRVARLRIARCAGRRRARRQRVRRTREVGSSSVEIEARGSAPSSSTVNDRRASAGSGDDGGAQESVELCDRGQGAEEFGDGKSAMVRKSLRS